VRTILLADDDAQLRKAVSRMLAGRGYIVDEAQTAREAIACARDGRSDLAVVDLALPDGHGFDVVRACKQVSAAYPVLVLTGTSKQEERVQAFDAGADDVVGKPVCLPELLRRIEVQDRILRTTSALQRALREVDHERLFAAEAAALLAHDLNNGLFVVGANLSFLFDDAAVASLPDAREALTASERALRRMSTLVKNFVDIARSEDCELKAQRVRVSPGEIVRAAASIHYLRGSSADGGIEIDCDDELEAYLDPILFERILHNLLINATRYVEPNGRVWVGVAETEDGVLVVRVANTGPVIVPSLRAGLFEKYRKGGDRKAQFGMGLYFCRLACEAHGGSIALVDVPDFATCFELRLPSKPPVDLETR
jgi:signal transduction histidine kinase